MHHFYLSIFTDHVYLYREPFILMENNNAVKQRKAALVTIAEGMARQWFGWRIFPENWRDQWVITGLARYAAYEIVKDVSMLLLINILPFYVLTDD